MFTYFQMVPTCFRAKNILDIFKEIDKAHFILSLLHILLMNIEYNAFLHFM